MSNFTASNGIELNKYGKVLYHTGGGDKAAHKARKEFYQHLRDKELGQTREGNIFIRPLSEDRVLVRDEITDKTTKWSRHEVSAHNGVFGRDEAKRYFEAHPEKPWQDAQPGEIWVLEFGGDERAYIRTDTQFINWGVPSLSPTDPEIKGGYRIEWDSK